LKLTLDTGCVNTKPDTHLDQIFELHQKGQISLYVPDGVLKDILKEDFSLSAIDDIPDTPSGMKVKQRLRKIERCSVIRGTLLCGDDVYGRVGGTSGGKNVEAYESRIGRIINSSYDYEDIRILMLHLSAQNDFFVTRNTRHFVNGGRRDVFFNEFAIRVITPDQFIHYYEQLTMG
jgi:hypothetical protein